MAIGNYGIVRPADVSFDDIDMFYNYTPNRETSNNDMIRMTPVEDFLSYINLPTGDDIEIANGDNILEGLYNLKLPATIFNQLGIYTIYIRPKVFTSIIDDCSVLSALPTVKGILINIANLPSNLRTNNALQGYKVEYVNSDGSKLRNVVRYIVSANKVSPITVNNSNTNQATTRYYFNDAGPLMFLQLTPSSASDVKPNMLPFIGNIGQIVLISNTFFTPLTVEVELVENTLDTIANIVAGEQVKDVKNGILTYYDKDRVITKQFDLYEIKDEFTDVPLYEVKEKRTTIDETQNFNTIIENVQ